MAAIVTKTITDLEIEKHFNMAIAALQTRNKNKFINTESEKTNQSTLKDALYEENNRLAQEIRNRGNILNLIEEYSSGNKVSLRGSEGNTSCVLGTHEDKNPSFTFNTNKNVYHCMSCGESGDIIKLAMEVQKLSYVEAVKELAHKFNIPTRYDDIKAQFGVAKTLREQQEEFLLKHPKQNRATILEMNEKQFRSHVYDTDNTPSKEKVYTDKPVKPKKEQPKEEKNTRVVSTAPVDSSIEAVTYLARERAITHYPKELQYIIGEMQGTNENGKPFTIEYKGVGFINESGGADIRIPQTFSKGDTIPSPIGILKIGDWLEKQKKNLNKLEPEQKNIINNILYKNQFPNTIDGLDKEWTHHIEGIKTFHEIRKKLPIPDETWKKSRSVGHKDIVVINKELLGKTDTYIVSESAWDYTAAYNQSSFKPLADNAVGIIANGIALASKAIDFINQNSTGKKKVIVLTQADEPNHKFTNNIILGTRTPYYVRVEFTNEEHQNKEDINDLHVKDIEITKRFYGSFDPLKDLGVKTQQTTEHQLS